MKTRLLPSLLRAYRNSTGCPGDRAPRYRHARKNRRRDRVWGVVALSCVVGCSCAAWKLWKMTDAGDDRQGRSAASSVPLTRKKSKTSRPLRLDLPTYTTDDLLEHNSVEKGIWVRLDNGVYDITQYMKQHPGGERIMMAAGKNLQPFWDLFPSHQVTEVSEMMEESMRVGNIFDSAPPKVLHVSNPSDPYLHEPKRNEILQEVSSKPFQGETPSELLDAGTLTPNGIFFVCNHQAVPKISAEDYRLKIGLDDSEGQTLSLGDLKNKFVKSEVTVTAVCLKNRSREMSEVKVTEGSKWGHGAVSTAKWAGVRLGDLLSAHGVDLDKVRSGHIVFEGMDVQEDGKPYGASIPVELARQLKDDIVVAYEMNQKTIPRDHGFPVRLVVPGVAAARHVKWLSRIYLSREESSSMFQRHKFKVSHSSLEVGADNADKFLAISQLPITSAICEPTEGTVFPKGTRAIAVRGYAYSGGGMGVARVDVSADGGVTWVEAELRTNEQPAHRAWAWSLWDAYVPLPGWADPDTPRPHKKNMLGDKMVDFAGSQEDVASRQNEDEAPGYDEDEASATDEEVVDSRVELVVKAVDAAHNCQPDHVTALWNKEGVLNNSWHRVHVKVA